MAQTLPARQVHRVVIEFLLSERFASVKIERFPFEHGEQILRVDGIGSEGRNQPISQLRSCSWASWPRIWVTRVDKRASFFNPRRISHGDHLRRLSRDTSVSFSRVTVMLLSITPGTSTKSSAYEVFRRNEMVRPAARDRKPFAAG